MAYNGNPHVDMLRRGYKCVYMLEQEYRNYKRGAGYKPSSRKQLTGHFYRDIEEALEQAKRLLDMDKELDRHSRVEISFIPKPDGPLYHVAYDAGYQSDLTGESPL